MRRAEYLANSLTSLAPWRAEGISRASWYRRRRRDVRETSARLETSPQTETSAGAEIGVAAEAPGTSASGETSAEAEAVETSPQPSQTASTAESFCATANADAERPLDIYEALAWRHALSTGKPFDREAHREARAFVEKRLDEMASRNTSRRDWCARSPDGTALSLPSPLAYAILSAGSVSLI